MTENLSTKNSLAEKLRLPAMVFYEYSADNGALLREAADEIDRLTERLAGAYASVNLLTEMLEAKAPQEATEIPPMCRFCHNTHWPHCGTEATGDPQMPFQPMPGDESPVSQQEVVSAIHHHARELARLTETWPSPEPARAEATGTPDAWRYTVNGVHVLYDESEPPSDAFDEGSLVPLYRHPHEPPQPAEATECRYCDEVMKERDDYHEWADTLAYDIERLVGVEIGEHSNLNSPWGNAHDAAEYELDKRARKPHEPGETCAWAYVDDGSWLTNCGETAILENGGTAYSDMRFCCFCGKPTP